MTKSPNESVPHPEQREALDSTSRALSPQGRLGWPAIVLIAIVAFLARAAFGRLGLDSGLFEGLAFESRGYEDQAISIGTGQGAGPHPYLLSPLYPYVLAAFVDSAAHSLDHQSLRTLQAIADAATCVLAGLLAARIGGRRAGLIAGLACGLFGPLIHASQEILVACLQAFFLTLGVLLVVIASTGADVRRTLALWLGAGASLGIAAGFRSLSLAVAVAIVAVMAIDALVRRRERGRLRAASAHGAAFLVGLALAIAPLTARNAVQGDGFVLLSADGGMNFWIGNHAGASGIFHAPSGYDAVRDPVGKAIVEQNLAHSTTDAAASDWWRQRALRDVREDPWAWVALLGKKLLLCAHPAEIPELGESYAWFRERAWPLRFPLDARTVLIFALLAPFAFLVRGERARLAALRFPLAALGAHLLAVALFFVTGQNRVPILPIAIAIAAAGVVEGAQLVARPGWTKSAATLALLGSVPILFFASSAVYRGPLAIHESSGAEERQRGTALFAQGRYADAVDGYERALERSDDAATRKNLAHALQALGRAGEAAQQYRIVLARDPHDGVAWFEYGNLLRANLHDLRAAQEAYRQATEADPRMAEAHFNLGVTLLELDEPEDARAAIDAALQLAPEDASWRPDAERVRVQAVMRIVEKKNAATPPR